MNASKSFDLLVAIVFLVFYQILLLTSCHTIMCNAKQTYKAHRSNCVKGLILQRFISPVVMLSECVFECLFLLLTTVPY